MINNNLILNVYENQSSKSRLSTQLLYGEKFSIIKVLKNRYKIKSSYDHYIGYITKKKFPYKIIPTHKVSILEANLFSKPDNALKLKKKISFGSLIKVQESKNNFYKFDKYWIKKNSLSSIDNKKKLFSNIKLFKDIKYKWGGNSSTGIDCSALVQIFFKYNNKYCPRDTKDQINYFKNVKDSKKFNKNQLIFWKGHVAICLNKKFLIHAYGPKKKVVIMNIKNTIKEIEKNSKLKVIGVKI
jgi:gamma-D-glutamyl-L-lysine dipeptidyl-peptidase